MVLAQEAPKGVLARLLGRVARRGGALFVVQRGEPGLATFSLAKAGGC